MRGSYKVFLFPVFIITCFSIGGNVLFQWGSVRSKLNTSLKVLIGRGAGNNLYMTRYASQSGFKQKTQENGPKNETEDEFMLRMEDRMEQRKGTLSNVCKSLNLPDARLTALRLIPAEKYNLVYCFIPKAGCTHMKFLVMALNGLYNFTYRSVHYAAKRIMLTGKAIPDPSNRKKLIKVILVRHPYERLVSAFLNKIDSKQEKVFYAKSLSIRRRYGNSSRYIEKGKTANFEEFVDYLTDENRPPLRGGVNAHWNTYHSLCQPCAFQYDVIAHLETVDEDVRYLLKLIKAPSELKYKDGYSGKGESKTSRFNLVNKYFENLPLRKKKKLFNAYKADFDLFNYDQGVH